MAAWIVYPLSIVFLRVVFFIWCYSYFNWIAVHDPSPYMGLRLWISSISVERICDSLFQQLRAPSGTVGFLKTENVHHEDGNFKRHDSSWYRSFSPSIFIDITVVMIERYLVTWSSTNQSVIRGVCTHLTTSNPSWRRWELHSVFLDIRIFAVFSRSGEQTCYQAKRFSGPFQRATVAEAAPCHPCDLPSIGHAMSVSIQKQTELCGHKWQISCLEFSRSGLHLASGGWDKAVKIWDLSTLDASFTLPHASEVTSLAWLPGTSRDKLIATATSDGNVSFWNGQNGNCTRNLEKQNSWVLTASFNSDGELLATGSWDKQIRLWNTSTGQFVGNLPGHTTGVWTVSFHPDKTSSLLCSGAADGSLKLWDTRLKNAVLSLVGGHDDDVKCCAWSPDGACIASGSADSKVGETFIMLVR